MFIKNKSQASFVCRRAELPKTGDAPPQRFAAIQIADAYRFVGPDRLEPATKPAPDAIEPACAAPLWHGTSITVVGEVRPPEHGALARRVELRAGDFTRTLVARGARKWQRGTSGGLSPSKPAPWEPLSMTWSEAFGGRVEVAAHRDPRSGLPVPKHLLLQPHNHDGKGFVLADADALDQELPRLELLEDQLTHPTHQPLPGCFAPRGAGQAALAWVQGSHPSLTGAVSSPIAPSLTAPGYLVFDWMKPGATIAVSGMARDMAFTVRASRCALKASRDGRGARYGMRLRAVHIDANEGMVWLVWQHLVLAAGPRLPDVDVVMAEEVVS